MIYIIYMVIFLAMFYFIAIRPANKQNKQHQLLIESLKINDVVTTSGGIVGKVILISDEFVNIESLNSEIKIIKRAIISIEKGE